MSTLASAESFARADTRPAMFLPTAAGFFFGVRVIIVLLYVRLFEGDPQTGVEVELGFNFLLLLLAAFHSMGPASRPLRFMLQVPSFRWVLVFIGFSGCSLLWSSTASLAAAVAYWCALLADVAIVVLLFRTDSIEDTSRAIMRGFVWGACAVAFAAWVLPAQSDLRLGDEELLGPNQIGYACAFAFFLAQYLTRQKERFWNIPAVFLAITLLRSLSKTTIVAFAVGQGYLLFRDRSISRKGKILIAIVAGLTIAIFWGLIESYYTIYTNAGDQAETLTGRIGIWAVFLSDSLEKPWIGHGFHSVWKVIPPFGNFEARHAHNELLQQFYAYGVAGVIMLFALYGNFYRQIRKLPTGHLKTFLFSFLLFILVRGLADTEAFDLSLPLWAVTMFGLIMYESVKRDRVMA